MLISVSEEIEPDTKQVQNTHESTIGVMHDAQKMIQTSHEESDETDAPNSSLLIKP